MSFWYFVIIIYFVTGLILTRQHTWVFYLHRREILDQHHEGDRWTAALDVASDEIKLTPLVLWGFALIWPLVVFWRFSFWMVRPPRRQNNKRLTSEQIREIEKEVEIGELDAKHKDS